MASITNQSDMIKLVPVSAVSVIGDQIKTTSLKVAEFFGKQHKDVLRKLESLDCSAEFSSAHFCAHVQKVSIGKGATRESKYYEMTKDGFMFLVMGFTGKVAAQIKEAYINAFNAMALAVQAKPKDKAKTKGLTLDQQISIKELVKARVDVLPQDKRAKAAITCWSALKSKFGCTYKDITPDLYTEAVSLVARLPLEGEFLPRQDTLAAEQQGLSPLDLFHLYGYVSASMQIIDMHQQLKPVLDAFQSMALFGLRERVETLRACSAHFHKQFGQSMIDEARSRGTVQTWLNFKALYDRNQRMILL